MNNKSFLIVIVALSVSLSSCSVMESFVTTALDNGCRIYMENNGHISSQEILSAASNTREAMLWKQGAGGKATVVSDALMDLTVSFSKNEDVTRFASAARGLLQQTQDNLLKDPSWSRNDATNIIGTVLYGTGNFATKVRKEHAEQDFIKWQMEAADPNSSLYDPYFDCRYYLDPERGMCQYSFAEIQECIAARQKSEYSVYQSSNYELSYTENGSQEGETDAFVRETQSSEPIVNAEDRKESVEMIISESAIEFIEKTVVEKFPFDVAEVPSAQMEGVQQVAELLKENPSLNLLIVGHTCDIGSSSVNIRKGMQRAEAVKSILLTMGIDKNRIVTKSMGSTQPIAPNNSGENRAKNRRVEFKISE